MDGRSPDPSRTRLEASMTRPQLAHSRLARTFVLVSALLANATIAHAQAASSIPSRLSDKELWQLNADFSEPNGYFRSDNFLSNETGFQFVIPDLLRVIKPGGVYLGVGPEQNFTYIAALQPKI